VWTLFPTPLTRSVAATGGIARDRGEALRGIGERSSGLRGRTLWLGVKVSRRYQGHSRHLESGSGPVVGRT
jgi:hypothetical protein